MSRLTIEQLENYRNTYDKFDGINGNEFDEICDELIKYKHLEDELGCPLEVVFKAIDKGIIIMGSTDKYGDSTIWVDTIPVTVTIDGKHIFEEPRLIKYEEWCFSCKNGSYCGCVCLKDYKKTWWLKGDLSE